MLEMEEEAAVELTGKRSISLSPRLGLLIVEMKGLSEVNEYGDDETVCACGDSCCGWC